jgi:hypothetical protein
MSFWDSYINLLNNTLESEQNGEVPNGELRFHDILSESAPISEEDQVMVIDFLSLIRLKNYAKDQNSHLSKTFKVIDDKKKRKNEDDLDALFENLD